MVVVPCACEPPPDDEPRTEVVGPPEEAGPVVVVVVDPVALKPETPPGATLAPQPAATNAQPIVNAVAARLTSERVDRHLPQSSRPPTIGVLTTLCDQVCTGRWLWRTSGNIRQSHEWTNDSGERRAIG